ncbi:bifunctional protein tyrosine phosphatase family protein/NAD(P)/FAD-dependent oxidoreductase [Aurantimonas sp. VKM B-3413]|uniref:bifunctional protein tyrosine phosphatase family protein/NAD(P)/FAD-dependent oxidoreductase n=1 Tax=Aurantimonas sp. VKM B-3413 TaxID=2779401 RepID=UPI001E5016A3|nr:bifunctional protein tyrosine phosphatase family protein/NAD(P)/FAD-dependent oxidoreductase [Aurantimonas sp. VKM B-3413]MCB8839913.1 TIGR01244 family phosphatase [Aurantimonas sp. VKM B-3413]
MSEAKKLTPQIAVRDQVRPEEIPGLKSAGFRAIIANRPDGEGGDQPTFAEIEAAATAAGMEARYLPVETGKVSDEDAARFGATLEELPKPVVAFCRSGTRSTTLWSLSQAGRMPLPEILERAKSAGYDMSGVTRRIANGGHVPLDTSETSHDIVIVGGGAGGIAAAASLRARANDLDIAIIDPADIHYYQPGWTLVGGGVFKPEDTRRDMASLIPDGVKWIRAAVAAFEPEAHAVILEGCRVVRYKKLIVAPGLKLNWGGVEGLEQTLGRNGVTSNYRYDLAPYTWELVRSLSGGTALFTQPPMPIKCAGAPQKAMYLSAYEWERRGDLENVNVEFLNAGGVLFGVKDYVPALMEYVKRYGIDLTFNHDLKKIDGPAKTAWFEKTDAGGNKEIVERKFDMIHVVPPQTAPDFIRVSPLANEAGWVEVDQATLRHVRYPDIYSLGDVMSAPNAKTAAAARKQAPVVAENLLRDLGRIDEPRKAIYDGYGSCPLTVERGKVVLAEFAYGGRRVPSFPRWFIDDLKPSKTAWLLKEKILPPVYWQAMLKGREPMARPEHEKAGAA